jgi:hypothetical protein
LVLVTNQQCTSCGIQARCEDETVYSTAQGDWGSQQVVGIEPAKWVLQIAMR